MNLNHFMKDKAQALKEPRANPAASYNSFAALPDGYIPEGRRNIVMSHIARRLVKRYGDTREAGEIFLEKAKRCIPPLDENELDSIWSSAVKFGKAVSAQPGYVPRKNTTIPLPANRMIIPTSDKPMPLPSTAAIMSAILRLPTTSYMTVSVGKNQNPALKQQCN